ncbi:hypothetical protein DRQ00_07025 [candidate division KSB1 bacterium]|nr:MAG: hypothetical protein DRQ00_07025 [candidate division KSB1 bacterium]
MKKGGILKRVFEFLNYPDALVSHQGVCSCAGKPIRLKLVQLGAHGQYCHNVSVIMWKPISTLSLKSPINWIQVQPNF